jgi:hypothetical protein
MGGPLEPCEHGRQILPPASSVLELQGEECTAQGEGEADVLDMVELCGSCRGHVRWIRMRDAQIREGNVTLVVPILAAALVNWKRTTKETSSEHIDSDGALDYKQRFGANRCL